jgi:hypothetical protein
VTGGWCWSRTFFALAGLWLAAGCGRTPAGIVPVSGRVTLDGQPLAGAVVTFQPMQAGDPGAGGSSGRTDAEGRFVLTLIDPPTPGALAGLHVVTITTATVSNDDAARPTGERVPRAWRDGSQTFEVPPGGTASAELNLESSAP